MRARKITVPTLLVVMAFCVYSAVWSLPSVTSPNHPQNPFVVRNAAVNVEVVNHLIRTTIVQQIFNDGDEKVPCSFEIVLPKEARASAFSAIVDGVEYTGKIVLKNVARAIVQEAQEKEVAAAYVEESNGKLRVVLSQVKAKQEFTFRVSYIEQAQYKYGAFHYNFGVMNNNREMPNPDMFTMSILFDAPVGLNSVESDTHKLRGQMDKDKGIFDVENIGHAKRDFHMSYTLNLQPGKPHLMLKDAGKEDPYFCLLMLPPELPRIESGRSTILILDKSGSMQGSKFSLAVKALEKFINRLNDEDLVNVHVFDTQSYPCAPFPFLADAIGKKKAIKFIQQFSANNGTRFLKPLVDSINTLMLDKQHIPAIVLLTDGEDNVDKAPQFYDAVNDACKFKVPIFTFAIGSSVNFALLRTLSEYSGASLGHIVEDEDMLPALAKISDKYDRLLAHSVELEAVYGACRQLYPQRLCGMYFDEPVIIYGRLDDEKTVKMTLSAYTTQGKWREGFNLSTLGEHSDCDFLDAMWGARRISDLLDRVGIFGADDLIKEEIIALSYRYLLTSPYTSLVFSQVEFNIPDEEEKTDRTKRYPQQTGVVQSGVPQQRLPYPPPVTTGAGRTCAPRSVPTLPPSSIGITLPPTTNLSTSVPRPTPKKSMIPMFNSKLEIVNRRGKPVADQLSAHVYALAFAVGSTADEDEEPIDLCEKWLLDNNGLAKLNRATDLLAAAYGLTLIWEPSKKNEAAKKSLLNAIAKLDATQISNATKEEIALSAFFCAKLVEFGEPIPKTLVSSIKAALLSAAYFKPNDIPSGSGMTMMARWCEWFPILVACGKGFGFDMPEEDKLESMLRIAVNSPFSYHSINPNIAHIISYAILIRDNVLKGDSVEQAKKSMAMLVENAQKKMEGDRTSFVHKILGDRLSDALAPLLR